MSLSPCKCPDQGCHVLPGLLIALVVSPPAPTICSSRASLVVFQNSNLPGHGSNLVGKPLPTSPPISTYPTIPYSLSGFLSVPHVGQLSPTSGPWHILFPLLEYSIPSFNLISSIPYTLSSKVTFSSFLTLQSMN